jgi:hypothetical protein
MATKVSPISASDNPKALAIIVVSVTKYCAPSIRKPEPNPIDNTSSHIL